MILVLFVLACGTDADEACPDGSSRHDDGLCHLDDDGSGDGGATTGDGGTGDGGAGDGGSDGGAGDGGAGDGGSGDGLAILGGGSHSIEDMLVEELVTDDLAAPRDLEYNPERPEELWIVNQEDSSITIVWDAGESTQYAEVYAGPGNDHWLAKPSGIAFGDEGFVGTSHDSLGNDDGEGPVQDPPNAMGPTLWPTDLDLFDGGQASHLDMVHDTAASGGIAWAGENRYWVHDGYRGGLTWYDFRVPHEPGGTDHADALVLRCAQEEVGYLEGVAQHMVLHEDWLYFADAANGRVVKMDVAEIDPVTLYGNPDVAGFFGVDSCSVESFIEGDSLATPAGMELHEGLLFVTDHTTGYVLAYDLDGQLVDWMDTGWGEGVLQGMTFDADGNLLLVDGDAERIVRVSPG